MGRFDGCISTHNLNMVSLVAALVLTSSLPMHDPVCGCHAHMPVYEETLGIHLSNGLDEPQSAPRDVDPREKSLGNLQQLTFGGQNAEAYWNVAGDKLVYQARIPGYPDEQIFQMYADGSGKELASTGLGRCTCSYYSPDGKWIYFSSTHEYQRGAQAPPDMSKGYVWVVNPWFALYRVAADQPNGKPEQIFRRFGYVAETTISPDGKFMTFTGAFDGDLEIYRADLMGGNVERLTTEVGYDGGPFVSWDSKKILYRRDPVESEAELKDFRSLLTNNMVRPGNLEIWVMDADGKNKKQITNLKAASFAPFLHPDGETVIFCSNYGDPKGREFDLFAINLDGSNFRQITFTPEFDGFPMFDKTGKKLVFSSNRFGKVRGETNIFTADWKE
jgi:Tol biopolymer transport system component